MRRLDFISGSPQLNIFKEGANKTNLGGTLYLIYILVLILLAIVYLFDYFSNEKYDFNYNIVKTDFKDKKLEKDKEMNSMLNTNLEFSFMLSIDDPNPERGIYNNNFIIIDSGKLYDKLMSGVQRDDDGWFVLKSDENENTDDCILKQEDPHTLNTGDLHLAVNL